MARRFDGDASPRRRIGDRADALSLALLLGTAVVTAALWNHLPARIPTHFDLHGRPDAWSSRGFGVAVLPSISALTWLLVRFGAALVPRATRERLQQSPTSIVALLVVALMSALHFAMLWSGMHGGASIGVALGLLLGLFWIVLGLVMPRVRRNPFIGVRTAWTLASDENWARTHRFASKTFVLGGLVAVLAAIVALPSVAVVAVLVSGLVPVVYSWVVARKMPSA